MNQIVLRQWSRNGLIFNTTLYNAIHKEKNYGTN